MESGFISENLFQNFAHVSTAKLVSYGVGDGVCPVAGNPQYCKLNPNDINFIDDDKRVKYFGLGWAFISKLA